MASKLDVSIFFRDSCAVRRIARQTILISLESYNLGNAKALGLQRSKIGPYTHMDLFLIVEAQDFGTAEIATFK